MPIDQQITIARAAAILGVGLRTVHRWRVKGYVPAIKMGVRWYVKISWVTRILEKGLPNA